MAALEGVKSAADTTKQFITLATGVLTLTITFSDKFGGGVGKLPLFVAWLAFMFVIIRGTTTLMEITRAIHRAEKGLPMEDGETVEKDATIVADPYHARISKPAKHMVLAFWGGMGAILIAGVVIIVAPAKPAAEPKAEPATSVHVLIDRSEAAGARPTPSPAPPNP